MAQLQGAYLVGAQLQGARLFEAQLQGADLEFTKLEGANLWYTQLRQALLVGAQLEEADFENASLQGAHLEYASLQRADFENASLLDAHLEYASLQSANLNLVQLQGTHLEHASLQGADLTEAQLQAADLSFSDLRGTNLSKANLEGVNLQHATMDVTTKLLAVKLDRNVQVADVIWDNVPLIQINWESVPRLSEEDQAQKQKWPNLLRRIREALKAYKSYIAGLQDSGKTIDRAAVVQLSQQLRRDFFNERRYYVFLYKKATGANRQLAIALREQGLVEEAEHFEYRAQILQRVVFRRQRKIAKYLFSCFLALLTGYGFRMWRIIVAYVLINLLFTIAYLGFHLQTLPPNPHAVNFWEALLTSVQVFHGRIFNPFGLAVPDARLIISSLEAIIGLVIEATFIAMLTQRFFHR